MVITLPPSLAHHPADPVGATMSCHDRRRPGRFDLDPALFALLRGLPASEDAVRQARPPAMQEWGADRSKLVRCLFFTVLLAIPSWGIVGALGYWIIH